MKSQIIEMTSFKTHLRPDQPYYYGNRIIDEFGDLIKKIDHDKVYFVTNEFIFEKYVPEIVKILKKSEVEHEILVIKDGEDHKNFATLELLCDTLVEKGVSKDSLIVGMGGGCITNVIGLAAGLIFRGIRYVEVPTTLTGLTDSTMSNKQAINGKHGKNQFGMYYAPILIFGDTRYLVTESPESKKTAIVEGIKNGFISNPHLLDYFEKRLDEKIEKFTEADLHELALKIIQSKIAILKKDPSEKGFAVTLEYGHTFGHAIEFLSKGKVQHGLAVAKGMCISAELSMQLGHLTQKDVDRHYHLLRDKLGLDISIPDNLTVDAIMKAMLRDNKKTDMGVKYVLLKEVGSCLDPDGDHQIFVGADIVRKALVDYQKRNSAEETAPRKARPAA